MKEDSLEFISRFSIQPRDLWCGSEDYGSTFFSKGLQLREVSCFMCRVFGHVCNQVYAHILYHILHIML